MSKKIITAEKLISSFLFILGSFNNGYALEQAGKSQTYDDITVSVASSFEQKRHHGYAEHRITIQNTSADQIHIVTLSAPKVSYSRGDGIRKLTKTIAITPASETTVSIFQPAANVEGRNLEVIIDNKKQKEDIELKFSNLDSVYYQFGRRFPDKMEDLPLCILLSQNVSYDSFKKNPLTLKLSQTTKHISAPETVKDWMYDFSSADSKIESWSDNWLAYTPYDGIVVTAEDMQSIPENVKSAILKYIRCGGSLLVLGKWEGVKQWQDTEENSDSLKLYYIDFGVCIISEISNVQSWQEQTWQQLNAIAWQQTGKELLRYRGIAAANDELQVVDTLAIPVRGLFILVFVFAIVIGPVNLLVLHRMKKRIWMLWTVPVIAILTSAAVFSYALYTEGLDSNSRTRSITILNQKSDTATTIGIDAFYCPLTPRGGLHYNNETELTPLGLETWQRGRARTIDWTNDQYLESGWIAGRVPAHFLLRKSRTDARSVNVITNNQNKLFAENYFGTNISSLWYADKDGRIYSAQNIAAGAKAELTLTQNTLPKENKNNTWRNAYSSNWTNAYDGIIEKPQEYLMPGTYIAVLNTSPFVEQSLAKIKKQNLESVVFGITEGPFDEGRSR